MFTSAPPLRWICFWQCGCSAPGCLGILSSRGDPFTLRLAWLLPVSKGSLVGTDCSTEPSCAKLWRTSSLQTYHTSPSVKGAHGPGQEATLWPQCLATSHQHRGERTGATGSSCPLTVQEAWAHLSDCPLSAWRVKAGMCRPTYL